MKAARLVACLFLSVAALNSAHVIAQQTNDTATPPAAVTDPLAKELVRCKALHEQAASEPWTTEKKPAPSPTEK